MIATLSTLLVVLGAASAEYCSGYTDSFGDFKAGFSCPRNSLFSFNNDDNDEIYCCGTSTYKYCCSWRSGTLNVGSVMGGLFAVFVLVVIVTVISCYMCSCCVIYKRRQANRAHVITTCTTGGAPVVMTTTSTTYPAGPQPYPQGQHPYPQGQQPYPQGQQPYPGYPQGPQPYPLAYPGSQPDPRAQPYPGSEAPPPYASAASYPSGKDPAYPPPAPLPY